MGILVCPVLYGWDRPPADVCGEYAEKFSAHCAFRSRGATCEVRLAALAGVSSRKNAFQSTVRRERARCSRLRDSGALWACGVPETFRGFVDASASALPAIFWIQVLRLDFCFGFGLWFESFAGDVPVGAWFCLTVHVRRGLFEDFIESGGPLHAELGSQLAAGAQEV